MSQSSNPTRQALHLEMDKLKACIHCGLCLPACPTYNVTGSEAESPRGRLYLMRSLLEGKASAPQITPHLEQCLACHGCESVCPSGVQYGRVLLSAREALASRNPSFVRRLKRIIFQHILPRHNLLLLGGTLLRLYQSGPQTLLRKLNLLKLWPTVAEQESLLPPLPKHHRALTPGLRFGDPDGEMVVLMVGCVMDVFYNPVHWDTITVLTANGYQVLIPEHGCCGALAHHAGETDITRDLARQNIDTMLTDNPQEHPAWIVLNSAGCGSSMQDYGHLLADDPAYAERARVFSEKVIDVMALLAKKPLAAPNKRFPRKVTYHAACHLYHVQKIKTEPLDVLRQVPGLELVPLHNMDACCGSAGIYNVEHPALSAEILSEKMITLKQACQQGQASMVATGNPGCMLQLAKGITDTGLPMSVQHPISILAEVYQDAHADNSAAESINREGRP